MIMINIHVVRVVVLLVNLINLINNVIFVYKDYYSLNYDTLNYIFEEIILIKFFDQMCIFHKKSENM